MGAPRQIVRIERTRGGTHPGIVPGDESQDVLEDRLVAWDREWATVGETVLLLGLQEQLFEEGMVEKRGADYESLRIRTHADRYVARGDVCRDPDGQGPAPQPPEHLAEPHDLPDFAGFSDTGGHFYHIYTESTCVCVAVGM